jgi:hypothetical protein
MGSFMVVKGSGDPIQFVSDDSSGFYVGGNEAIRIAGGNSIDTSATQDATDTITIALSNAITVNEISSTDSTAIQINDGLNVSGQINMQGNLIKGVANPVAAQDVATKNYVDSGIAGFGPGTVTSITAGTGLTASPSNPITSTGTISLDFNTVVARVVGDDSTGTDLRVGETIKIAGTSNITTAVSGDTLTITGPSLNNLFTVVGDDSTGTSFNNGEILKIAGTSNITTAVSGDTLTITGPNLSSFITASSSDILTNKTIDANGTGNSISNIEVADFAAGVIDTDLNSVSASDDTLPSAKAVKAYIDSQNTAQSYNLTFVGDDSTGTTVTTGEIFKIAGTSNITTAVSGDTLTITGSKDIDINSISSTDSTAVQINDAVNVSGLLTANAGLTINNNSNTWLFGSDGSTTLPAGGTITEGVVTSNPTIQLTPATPTVASQKLVIKGGGNYSFTTNGIEINYYVNTGTSGDTLIFYVYSNTYADQTLYWWIYPVGVGMTTPASGTVVLSGSGGNFSIGIDSDAYEFTVRVSPEANNYDVGSMGVESGLINADAPTFASENHLHLTTGNLTETSIFLGTDDHNVRTTTSGNIQITTPNTTNNVWEFGTNGSLTFPDSTIQNTAARITVVGDDSTGVTLNAGETIKIAGTSNITTAVSGDTLTITGPNLSGYLTSVPKDIDVNSISSGDSTAIQINDSINISGTVTANSGLVANGITYPTTDGTTNQVLVTNGSGILSFTSLNSFAGITFVGDDSTGSTINTAETLKFTGSNNITTTVIDDTVTITGSKDINVNSISSGDSSAIQINDNVNVSGTFNAKTIVTNDLISEDSTAINVLDGMNVSGTLSADVLDVNEISSSDSSAIQINDSLNASGTITAASFVTHGASGNITGVNNIEVNQISSNDSTAVQVADGLNVSGTLTASTIVTNDISSGDSTAIQINDAVNVSGVITGGSNVIASQNLISNNSSGDEGGEILLAKPQTNSTIAGTGVTIDVWQNRLRFFEQGGSARGYYIDITNGGAGVSTLLTGGGGGGSGTVTSITAGTGLTASPSNPITTTGTISLDFSTVVARIVGDDSTGTDLQVGETIKIAGTSNITTAVSGDTLTITGPDLSSYLTNSTLTVVGDDSTGTTLNTGETIKIAGAGGITTAVSGDVLTITGANQAQGITFFDDASTSTAIPDGGALQITSGAGISTSILGNVITITNTSTQLEIDGGSAYSVYNAISEALIDGGTA